ncbi:MAG: MerR family DNA-binding transcriptional regulator [Rhodobacterales bacterium]|nr:MerR family DNA-binding transcriptional regulator [Rhodobacterales bacterium]
MTTETMTIREMCDAFDVTARTLRFYESKELLAPIRQGQKRLFTNRDRARLKLILRGKRFGFALEDIRQLLNLYETGDPGNTQLERAYELADERLTQMLQEREKLETAIKDLRNHMDRAKRVMSEKQAETID